MPVTGSKPPSPKSLVITTSNVLGSAWQALAHTTYNVPRSNINRKKRTYGEADRTLGLWLVARHGPGRAVPLSHVVDAQHAVLPGGNDARAVGGEDHLRCRTFRLGAERCRTRASHPVDAQKTSWGIKKEDIENIGDNEETNDDGDDNDNSSSQRARNATGMAPRQWGGGGERDRRTLRHVMERFPFCSLRCRRRERVY